MGCAITFSRVRGLHSSSKARADGSVKGICQTAVSASVPLGYGPEGSLQTASREVPQAQGVGANWGAVKGERQAGPGSPPVTLPAP